MHLTPISSAGLITIATGMFFFKADGASAFEELGICEPCTIKPEFSDQTIFDPRSGVRVLAQQNTTQTTVTITMTAKMLTSRVRALGWASDLTYENQASVTAGMKGFANVQVGGIYDIGKLNVANLTVTDTQTVGVAYAAGTNYEIDAEAGLLRVIAKPDGANTGLVVTYDAPAILAAALRPRLGIGSQPDLRGAFMCRGTNQVGVRQLVKIPIAQFRPSGEVALSSEDYTTVEIEGKVFADSTAAAGEELGVVQALD